MTGAVRHHPRNGRTSVRAPRAVAVLGATTALGQRLCARFLADPTVRFVLAVGREDLDHGALPRSERLIYRRVDLTRERETRELLFGPAKELGVDVVVHLAMHRDLHAGSRTHLQNVEALRWLLAAAERHPTLRRVVLRSHAEVYLLENHLANLITEDHPLDLSPGAPQWLRDRVEADLLACSRAGAGLEVAVLRCAEILAPGVGSQLYEMLSAPVCLRPAGFDPMLNLLSMEDAVDAFDRAVRAWGVEGPINIAGADTLPLTECIRCSGARCMPLPGPLLGPVNRVRRALQGGSFSYHLNARRLHVAAVLDGERARALLGYEPRHRLRWPGQANGHEAHAVDAPAAGLLRRAPPGGHDGAAQRGEAGR